MSRQDARRRAMSAFAVAPPALLRDAWEPICGALGIAPVRGPETGLVMLRGRVGGGGAPFNLGEASVTRASVRLSSGEIGHAMILGRDADKAGLAAAFDAAWQNADLRARIEDEVVAPALALEAEAERRRAEETEATRVDFFTMVRGED
ncbi:MAG: phosphonate C-P lyase system protein PhnG [Rhizobiaceae bacterium]